MREWKVRKGMMKKMTHLVVTPRVVREVRRHFDCPTLEGAELEDQVTDVILDVLMTILVRAETAQPSLTGRREYSRTRR